jgi:hypothetical protein
MQNYNGIWVHDMLRSTKDLETKTIGVGKRRFEARTDSLLQKGDIVIKWADDGSNKTVWQITEAKNYGSYPNRVVHGEMIDLISHGKLTKKIAEAVRHADKGFLPAGGRSL